MSWIRKAATILDAKPSGIAVEFHAPYAAQAPMIWGQRAMLQVMDWLPEGDLSLNLPLTVELSRPCDPRQLATAVRALVERHDALHTVFSRNPDTVQTVVQSGSLRIPFERALTVVRAPAPAELAHTARELADDLRREPFAPDDLPIRLAAVTAPDGLMWSIVVVLHHLAVDMWSARIVLNDLRALLSGATLPPRAQQPVERAHWEQSAQAQARERAARKYWESCFARLPSVWMRDLRRHQPTPMVTLDIESAALAAAARVLARESGLTPSMVVQSATALLLALHHGARDVALRTIVATRFSPETRFLVAAFNLNALLRLQLRDEAFSGFLRQARTASMRALATCEYDPIAMENSLRRIAADRGIEGGGYCFFNDVSDHAAAAPPLSRQEALRLVADTADETRFVEQPTPNEPMDASFFMFLRVLGDKAVLTLRVNPAFLAPGTPAGFLADLERLLITALRTNAGPLALEKQFSYGGGNRLRGRT